MPDHRILVVDDNFMQRKLLTENLYALGFSRVVAAASAAEAADRLIESHATAEPFDLVVLDWHMPGMEGDQFLAQCHMDARFKSVPVIIVTSEDEPKNILRAMKNGAAFYIIKPASYEDLKKGIDQVLSVREKNELQQ